MAVDSSESTSYSAVFKTLGGAMESSSQTGVTDLIQSSLQNAVSTPTVSAKTPNLSKTYIETTQVTDKPVPQVSSTQTDKATQKYLPPGVTSSYKDQTIKRIKRSAFDLRSSALETSSDKTPVVLKSEFISTSVDLRTSLDTEKLMQSTEQTTQSHVTYSTVTATKGDNSKSIMSVSMSSVSKTLQKMALRQIQPAPIATSSVPHSSNSMSSSVVPPIKSSTVVPPIKSSTVVPPIKSSIGKSVLSASDMKTSDKFPLVTPSLSASGSPSLKSNSLDTSVTDSGKQSATQTVDNLSTVDIKSDTVETNVKSVISRTTNIDLTPSETLIQTQIGDVLTPSKTLVQMDQIASSKVIVPKSSTSKLKAVSQSDSVPVPTSAFVPGGGGFAPVATSAFVPGGGGFIPMSSSVIPPLIPVNPSGPPGSSTPTPAPVLAESFALILGVSLCGVGMMLFLITLIIVCCRKKRPAKKNQDELRSHDLWVSTTAASDMAMANMPDPLPNFESVTEGVTNGVNAEENNKPTEQKVFVKPPRRRKPRGGINVFPRDPNEGKYRALHTFDVTQDGQLPFRKGDIIDVIEKTNDGWWKGTTGGREGWFPGSYIKEIRPRSTLFTDSDDNDKTSKPEPPQPKPGDKDTPTQSVSSFLLSKDNKPHTSVSRNHSDRQSPHRQATPKRESWALGKEVSIPKIPQLDSTKKSEDNTDGVVQSPVKDPRYGSGVGGMKFKVMYHYLANFKSELNLEEGEIVTAYEKDKNGWMRGRKDRTGEEGWFPAVYVQECTKQELEEIEKQQKKKHAEKDNVYSRLDPNHNNSGDQDWICIEHVAICPYAAEKANDLSFGVGEKVLVFQTLENGWWLGCRGDEVGWFPGAYVQLVYEDEEGQSDASMVKPSQPAYESLNGMSTFSSQKSDRSSYLSVHSNKSDDELSICSAASHSSTAESSSGRKPRPKRKAPKPPVSDTPGGSKLPTPIKPARPPPPQPNIHHSTPEHKDVFEDLGTAKQKDSTNPTVEIMITPEKSGNLSQKPTLPKRFVKPKLLKIPRRKLELHTASKGSSPQTRSPPPPRPALPKLLPPHFSQKSAIQNREQDNSNNFSMDQQASPESRAITQTWSPVNGFSLEPDTKTSSIEDMSSVSQNISGVNGILDHSDSMLMDPNCNKMLDKQTLSEQNTNRQNTVPKLVRQDALASTGQNSFREEINSNNLDHVNENVTPSQNEKHNVSRIPQFHNGHGISPQKLLKDEDHDVFDSHSIEDIKPPWEDEEFKENVNNISQLHNDHEFQEDSNEIPPRITSSNKDVDKPPVAPKPTGIPPPKFHYKGNVSNDSTIKQESPSSKRKMSGPKSNIPASPSKERKSGLPVSKSSKLPRQKSSERPVQQKNISGNEPDIQDSLDENSPSRSRSKPNRPNRPPESNNKNSSQKLSDTSPSRLPMMKSFQSPNSSSPKKGEEKGETSQKSSKGKRSIPVAKPSRPPPPNSPPSSPSPPKTKNKSQLPRFTSFGHGQDSAPSTDNSKKLRKSSLRKAVRGYQGQSDAELTFEEGSFITEIKKDEDNPGWFIGMLADGTRGLFHSSLVEEVSTSNMSTEV